MRVMFHREARTELRAAAKWYANQQAELQFRFEESIHTCIDRIALYPRQFPVVALDFRRALVDVFPYEIFFELQDQRVKVLAVAHSSREPLYWVKRR